MKHLYAFLLLFPLFGFAQLPIEQQLDSISTSEDALTYLKENSPKDGQLFTFNKEKHKTRLADDLFNLSKGGKKVVKSKFKKTYYKIVDKAEVSFIKFSIIVIDASKTSEEEALSKRDKVLAQYNDGYRFKDLAKHHSVGPLAKMGGDTGWIKIGDMSPAFDEVAFKKNHAIDEAFTVDDVENKKYYLVIKTQNRTSIEEITVLKLTEDAE